MLYITSYIIVIGFIYIATNTFKQLDGALFWENKFKSKKHAKWNATMERAVQIHVSHSVTLEFLSVILHSLKCAAISVICGNSTHNTHRTIHTTDFPNLSCLMIYNKFAIYRSGSKVYLTSWLDN